MRFIMLVYLSPAFFFLSPAVDNGGRGFSCFRIQDHALYTQYGGVVQDEEEGKSIAKALGPNKVLSWILFRLFLLFFFDLLTIANSRLLFFR